MTPKDSVMSSDVNCCVMTVMVSVNENTTQSLHIDYNQNFFYTPCDSFVGFVFVSA